MDTNDGGMRQPPKVIAVMGATGVGKSSFVVQATGQHVPIGHGLESCTRKLHFASFKFREHVVYLVDTPGFDDTHLSDVDVLSGIASWMQISYELGQRLTGILYLHRISDNRMGASMSKQLRMLRDVCGNEALKNVAIVSTMWDKVDMDIGAERETQLLNESEFWKELTDNGSRVARYDRDRSNTNEILELLVNQPTTALKLQRELVDEKKKLVDTTAGRRLCKELESRAAQLDRDLSFLKDFDDKQGGAKAEREQAKAGKADAKRDRRKFRNYREKIRKLRRLKDGDGHTGEEFWLKLLKMAFEFTIVMVNHFVPTQ